MAGEPEAYQQARDSIHKTANDPVSKLLLSSSHLTLPQFETLLADSISNEKTAKKSERHLFRPSGRNLSRGSYNRTLIQAQNNVIRSIYTILLLGYVGLFDTPALQPFLEVSDGLQGYLEELKPPGAEGAQGIDQLTGRLSETISALARRHSFKDTL
jgi:hypothetical protein